jgi:hypothetical protein
MNWLLGLMDGADTVTATPCPGDEDLSFVAFVPGTDVVVTFMPAPELGVIFVDEIDDLHDP